MSLVALANALLDEPMPRRFHAEPMVRAAELLLQERDPARRPDRPSRRRRPSAPAGSEPRERTPRMSRRLTTPDTPAPRHPPALERPVHVMVTNAGAGFSTCRGLDVTRWREDATRDAWGQFCYVRDLGAGRSGRPAISRSAGRPSDYEVVFSADKATFRRRRRRTSRRCWRSPSRPSSPPRSAG